MPIASNRKGIIELEDIVISRVGIASGLFHIDNFTAYLRPTHVKNKIHWLGFKQLDADEAVFIRKRLVIVAVYVDDFLVISDTTTRIKNFELSQSYTIRILGPVKRFLGLDIYHPAPTGLITSWK